MFWGLWAPPCRWQLCEEQAEGRERLELLCSPPSSQAGEEEWGCPLPARSSWHLPSLGDIPGGTGSAGISQKGPRGVSQPCAQPGLLSPRAALACRELPASETALLTSLSPSSPSSSSFLPCNARAGAVRAAFVKHFKARDVRAAGRTRQCVTRHFLHN